MRRTVFLAYPLSRAPNLDELERFVRLLRRRLASEGWVVHPKLGGPERLPSQHRMKDSRRVLASNVAGVTGSDVLVLLLPAVPEPTSVWVELGMALATHLAVVVVVGDDARLPYLARLLLDAGTTDGIHPAVRVNAEVPGDDRLVERVVAAVRSAVG